MAITAVKLVKQSGRQSKNIITLDYLYQVHCDRRDESPLAIRTASADGVAIPLVGSAVGAGIYYAEVGMEPADDSGYVWNVSVTASNAVDPGTINENPLERDPEYEWSTTTAMEPKYTDAEGNPIESSAGELFDPPIEAPALDAVLRITFNKASYDPAKAIAYTNSTNSDTWLIPGTSYHAAPHEAKVAAWTGRSAVENNIHYWQHTLEIHFREYDEAAGLYGWKQSVLDQGFYEGVPGGDRLKIMDDSTPPKPLNAPVKLDGAGSVLASGEPPVYRQFVIYKQRVFSGNVGV